MKDKLKKLTKSSYQFPYADCESCCIRKQLMQTQQLKDTLIIAQMWEVFLSILGEKVFSVKYEKTS